MQSTFRLRQFFKLLKKLHFCLCKYYNLPLCFWWQFSTVTVTIVPALIGIKALLTRLNHDFIRLFLPTIQVPYMVVDPVVVAFCLCGHVHRNKRVFFIRAMNDNEHSANFHLATCKDIILESCIFDELVRKCRRVFHLIEIISSFRFAENIDGAVVIVV